MQFVESCEKNFASHMESVHSNPSPWTQKLEKIQLRAMDAFRSQGLPTSKDEDWKFTPISKVVGDSSFHYETKFDSSSLQRIAKPKGCIEINLINGQVQSRSEIKEQGEFFVGALSDFLGWAEAKRQDKLLQLLERGIDRHQDSFNFLNTSLFSDAVVIYVGKGVQPNQSVWLNYQSSPLANGHADFQFSTFPKCLVLVEEGSRLSLVESFSSSSGIGYLTSPVSNIHLEENSQLQYLKFQNESKQGIHLGHTHFDLCRNSKLDSFVFSVGARLGRNSLTAEQLGEAAEANLSGLYLSEQDQHLDNRTRLFHWQPHGRSRQLYKGVLKDQSHSVFNGKIFIAKGAQKVDSSQYNHNLIIGEKAQADTKPELEVYADDVKANHGASVGQLDADQLFYFQSRGIEPSAALDLLTEGFMHEVVYGIKDINLRAWALESLRSRSQIVGS